MSLTESASRSLPRDRHLEVVEHVVVGLPRGLQLPVLARGERVQRQLDVVAQLLGALGPRGLVVDQLVLAPSARRRRAGRRGRRARAGGGDPSRKANGRSNHTGSESWPREPRVVARERRRAFSQQLALELARRRSRRGASRRRAARASARASRRPRSGSARAPGGRRSRSAGGRSARWGCAGRARTCSAADSCGRSRCPRPTAPGRCPCAAGTDRASAPRAGAIACARARSSALGRRAASSSSVEVWRISRCSGVAAASRRTLMSASASARLCPSGRCSSAESFSSSR